MSRNRHNLSHTRMFTADLGRLIPCGLYEILPGDIIRQSSSAFVRMSPMVAPVMHELSIRLHHFFVPIRICAPSSFDYEAFFTGGSDGNDAQTLPTMTSTGAGSDLLDYLGVPPHAGITINSLPVRAANMIFNHWYRDQDLVTERSIEATGIPKIAWEKNYLTTARPWPQKGDAVSLPLGTSADIKTPASQGGAVEVYSDGESQFRFLSADANDVLVDPSGGSGVGKLFADLSTATAATVTELRRALGLQRFQEARARWGSRYHEYVRQQFRTITPDARIQEPEYLGGGVGRMSISEVLQTGPDSSDAGQADLYGHGIGQSRSNAYAHKFTEHGYCITMFSVRPKHMVEGGLDRLWLRQDKEDFWTRELENIGEQEVLEQEIFADSSNAGNVFGYSERYQEYRQCNSQVAGQFRASTSDYWHLAQMYTSAPTLNNVFVECDPSQRIFNDSTPHHMQVSVRHNISARREVSRRAQVKIL